MPKLKIKSMDFLKEGSIAEQDGRLRIGDVLLEVNSKSVKECSHRTAGSLIKVSNDN